jgi:hypothetical protein
MPLPDFVIVGAQKAASTLLAECLGEHPQIAMPGGETQHFRDPEYARSSLDDLDRLFPPAAGVVRRGIKCPDYLARPECAERIHADLGTPDILVALRDPVSRAVSAYYWRVRWGRLPIEPAEVGLARILDGEYDARYPHAREILDWGRYGAHITRYLAIFPRNRVHVVFDESLYADGLKSVQQVYAALGVDASYRPRALRRISNPGVYNLSRLRFLAARNRMVVQEDNLTGAVKIASRSRAAGVFSAGIAGIDRLVLARVCSNAKPVLSNQLRTRLWDFYSEDMSLLEKALDVDVSRWRPI